MPYKSDALIFPWFNLFYFKDIDNFGESLPTQHEQYMKVRRRRFEKGNIIIKASFVGVIAATTRKNVCYFRILWGF